MFYFIHFVCTYFSSIIRFIFRSTISRNTSPYSSNNSIPSTSSVKTKKPNYKKNRKAPPPPSPLAIKKDTETPDIKQSNVGTEKENKDVVNENRRSIYSNSKFL